MRVRGLRDRCAVGHLFGQVKRLLRHMPDRKDRAEDKDEISATFKAAAFFFLRTNQQGVGRFEAVCSKNILFHIFGWVDDHPYAQPVP